MRYHDRHSGKSKFRQDGSYITKIKDENRLEWRRRKGFQKDQARTEAFCNCGRYLKGIGNRQNRRWAKMMLKSGRSEEVFYHQDMFASSWDAC